MTTSSAEPRTRRCESCGYRFVLDGDEAYAAAFALASQVGGR